MEFGPDATGPEAIGADIPWTDAHAALEARLRTVRHTVEQKQEAIDALREARAAKKAGRDALKLIRELEAEVQVLQTERRKLRDDLAEHRAAHGEFVRSALAPLRRAAAHQIVAAAETLALALAFAERCDAVVRNAGGQVPAIVPHEFVALLVSERRHADGVDIATTGPIVAELSEDDEAEARPYRFITGSWLHDALMLAGLGPEVLPGPASSSSYQQ